MGLIDSAEESEAVAASVQDTAGAIPVDLVLLCHWSWRQHSAGFS